VPWLALADDIRSSVSAAFGIRLELEPQLLGSPAEASVT